MKKHTTKLFAVLALLFALCICFSACAAKDGSSGMGGIKNEAADMAPGASGFGDTSTNLNAEKVETERKIIKTYQIYGETTAFDETVAALNTLVTQYGGYVEQASTSNQSLHHSDRDYARHASYSLRIPAEEADAFVGSIGSHLHVTRNESTVEDISETYYSVEARLNELIVERDSLLELMAATNRDYDLWLTISQRLSEVRQQIAVYEAQIRSYDSKVAYSSISLTVNEVLSYTVISEDNSYGNRLGAAFRKGWVNFVEGLQGFSIWLAEALPVLLLLGILAAGAAFIALTVNKKIKEKQRANAQNQQTQMPPKQ